MRMVPLIFLMGLCGYVWVRILTLSPLRGPVIGIKKQGVEIVSIKKKKSTFLLKWGVLFSVLSMEKVSLQCRGTSMGIHSHRVFHTLA